MSVLLVKPLTSLAVPSPSKSSSSGRLRFPVTNVDVAEAMIEIAEALPVLLDRAWIVLLEIVAPALGVA